MLRVTLIVLSALVYCTNGEYCVDDIEKAMDFILPEILKSTDYSSITIFTAYKARAVLEYLRIMKSYDFAEKQKISLQNYLDRAEAALKKENVVKWFGDGLYIWVADFSRNKWLTETTVSLKTPKELADETLASEALSTCISNVYAENSKVVANSRSCNISETCIDEMTKAPWIAGESIENRNRFYTFIKYQVRCKNLDKFYEVQVQAQLEILISEVKIFLAAEPFEDVFRLPLLSKIEYSGYNGYEDFLWDYIIEFILDNSNMCGSATDPSLDGTILRLKCYTILAMKLKALMK